MYIVNDIFISNFFEIRTDELFEKYNKGLIQLNIYVNSKLNRIVYLNDGVIHREGDPAMITYNNGKVITESYYIDGKLHRENNPAKIHYTFDGKKFKEEYFKNGLRHREDGPAFIEYNKDEISKKFYFYNNIQISINKINFSYDEFIDKIKSGKRIQKLYSNKILINMSNKLTNEEKTMLHDINDSKILLEYL